MVAHADSEMLSGRYRLERIVGGGAQAKVVLGADMLLGGRLVAIKTVTDADRGRLRTEYLALRSVRHPCLVEAIDYLHTATGEYLIEALVEGPSLDAVRGRDVLVSLIGVAHALAHLHARGFVHMDVKPANIVVQKPGPLGATLVDFGLVRMIGEPGASGTPGFVAPEILQGESATPAADVFSLAVTLGALLGFDPQAPYDTAAVSAEFRDLFVRARAVAPASRPSALEFAEVLATTLQLDVPLLNQPQLPVPLCGRAQELDAFTDWLKGAGREWRVSGVRGVGRTALLAACAERARADGRKVLAISGRHLAAVASLMAQANPSEPGAPTDGEAGMSAREQAAELVLRVDQLSARGPVLLALDDLSEAPVALADAVAIWRSRAALEPRLLTVDEKSPAVVGIELSPLGPKAVDELLRAAWARDVPPRETERFHGLSRGLPGRLLSLIERAEVGSRGWTLPERPIEDLQATRGVPVELTCLACAPGPLPLVLVRHFLESAPDGAALLGLAVRHGWLRPGQGTEGPTLTCDLEPPDRLAPELAPLASSLVALLHDAGMAVEAAWVLLRMGADSEAARVLADQPLSSSSLWRRAMALLASRQGLATFPLAPLKEWADATSQAAECEDTNLAAQALRARNLTKAATLVMARCLLRVGRYQEALTLCGDGAVDPSVASVRAKALYCLGRADAACEQCLAALPAAQGHDRPELLETLGHAYILSGALKEGVQALDEALAIAEASADRQRIAAAKHSLAVVVHRQGDLQRAETLYRESLIGSEPLVANVRTLNLATLLQDQGSVVEARELYREVFSRAVALANTKDELRAGVNLANLEVTLGNLAAGEATASQVIATARQGQSPHAELLATLVLAEACLEREAVPGARAALQQAELLLAIVQDPTAVAETKLLQARVTFAEGHSQAALAAVSELLTEGCAAHIAGQRAYWHAFFAGAAGTSEPAALQAASEAVLAARQGTPEFLWRALVVTAMLAGRERTELAKPALEEAQQVLEGWLLRMPNLVRATYLGAASRRLLVRRLQQGTALESARPRGERSGIERRLLLINRRLARERELKPLLEQILDTAIELMGAERGFLLLAEGQGVKVAVARNFEKRSLEDGRQRFSRSMASHVLVHGETMLSTNAQEDERFSGVESVATLQVRSVIAVPLKAALGDDDSVIGALYLDHRFQVRAFTEADVELCESFADLAAVAMGNARLFSQTRSQEQALAAQNAQLARLNTQLQREAAAYAEEAEHALRRLREEGPSLGVGRGFERIVGKSDRLREALRLVERFAETDVPVMIRGESGTGKELIARALHERSGRRARQLVSVNCGAIPETLMESELFGHARGAFTGATRDRPGLFAAAEGGTIFLDEIGEMPASMQVKLLRVLQEKEYRPVGSNEVRHANVRVVCASHRDLQALVAAGSFREDLLYRLQVVEIPVPALRERREDIPALVERFCQTLGQPSAEARFTPEAMACLLAYDWPGNVRELENEIRRAVALCDGRVDVRDLSEKLQGKRAQASGTLADVSRGSLHEILGGFEREVLLATLRRTGWNVRKAAVELGLSRAAFYTRMQKLGITREAHGD